MRILFICQDGATKSAMAVALTKAHAAEDVEADAAGIYSAMPVTEATRRALEAANLPLPKPARHAPEAFTRHADLIVSFTTGAKSMYGRPTLHWRPDTRAAVDDDETHEALLREIEALVVALLDSRGARRTPAVPAGIGRRS